MTGLANISTSSSFSSNKSYSSSSSSQGTVLTNFNNQKGVILILKNENDQIFKDLKSPSSKTSYRHSISIPSSKYATASSSSTQSLETDNVNVKSNNSFTAEPSSYLFDKITSGVVKNLRKKFLSMDSSDTSPPSLNFMTKTRSILEANSYSQSLAICELKNEKNPTNIKVNYKLDNIQPDWNLKVNNSCSRKKKLNKEADNVYQAKEDENLLLLKKESKEKFSESAVFMNVDIKGKINKFSVIKPLPIYSPIQSSSNKACHLLKSPHPLKYGGSCNNLTSTLIEDLKSDEKRNFQFDGVHGVCLKNSIDTDSSINDSFSKNLDNTFSGTKDPNKISTIINNESRKFNLQR